MLLIDQETKTDLLYFQPIAISVVRLIREASVAPVTIGIHGDWGAGKSSILKMIEAEFSADKTILCIRFNGWLFQGFEDAKIVLLETIIEELRRAHSTIATIQDKTKELLTRVDWIKVAKKAGGLVWNATTGMPTPEQLSSIVSSLKSLASAPQDYVSKDQLESIAGQMTTFLKDPASISIPNQIHAFREEFEKLLETAKVEKLVVLIDDLDRCLPNTTIETLEAIRLFLFVPRTAFVIAADEAMIEYSVKQHFPDLPRGTEAQDYARNYLEKLIQVPFRTPSLGIAETRTYLTLLQVQSDLGDDHVDFLKMIEVAKERLKRPWENRGLDRRAVTVAVGALLPTIEQAMQLTDQIGEILTNGTKGNPRQIKRFINSMLLRYSIAEARGFSQDIKRPILAKVMLAERFSPDFYTQLARHASASAHGKVKSLAVLEAESRKKDRLPQKQDKSSGLKVSLEMDDWMSSEWAREWASIEPSLAEIDLRPYIFVMRDKRGFPEDSLSYGHLDSLITRLLGPSLTAGSAEAELAQLNPRDAEQIFEALKEHILQADSFLKKPAGIDGLIRLVKSHPFLQRQVLLLIKLLPQDKLGAWAVGGWEECLVDPISKADFLQIRQTWSAQTSNKVLQTAVKGAEKVRTERH